VAGKSGVVSLVKGDVGLGNVTNESKATMFTAPTFTGGGTTVTLKKGTGNAALAFAGTSNEASALIEGIAGGGIKIYTSNGGTLSSPSWSTKMTIAAAGNTTFAGSVTATSLIKSGGTSSQFLKANGSVDSNTYLTASSTQSKYLRSDASDTFSAGNTLTIAGVARSTNNANADGPNFNVSTTNKSTTEYAYRVDRSGTTVGGIKIDGTAAFGIGDIDPDGHTSSAGGFGNIVDGGGWGARGLFIHGGGTGDAAAIGHNGTKLYFGIQNGSAANSMDTWLQVSPARVIQFSGTGLEYNTNTVWHAGNDGAGTGLDADLLDGIQGNKFLRTTTAPSLAGPGMADTTLSIGDSGSSYAFVQSHGKTLRINPAGNSVTIGSSNGTAWHSANDGAGSGLDADLLDGYQATAFQGAITAPNAPASVTTTIVGETIDVTFAASTTSNIDAYLVYSSIAGSDYGLISVVPPDDFSASMSIIDNAFDETGTQAYRVYAMKYGILSSATTASISYTVSSAEPTTMSVVNLNNAYYVQWNPPSSNARLVTAYNVYKHEHATQGSLSRSSASLLYSGMNTNYMYQISGTNNSNFHQFWVETTIA